MTLDSLLGYGIFLQYLVVIPLIGVGVGYHTGSVWLGIVASSISYIFAFSSNLRALVD